MERCCRQMECSRYFLASYPNFAPSKGSNWKCMVGLWKKLIAAIAVWDYYRSITTEELTTYFKEVEGILNWRPLTSVSSKTNDFDYLSPMSLLNSAIAPSVLPGHILKSESLKKSWKTSQLMAQDFWLRWQRIYLPTLIFRERNGILRNKTLNKAISFY